MWIVQASSHSFSYPNLQTISLFHLYIVTFGVLHVFQMYWRLNGFLLLWMTIPVYQWSTFLKKNLKQLECSKPHIEWFKTHFQRNFRFFEQIMEESFFSSTLATYLSGNKMFHQTSCVYTPQQNGIAERKYRHLLDTARVLLFTMGMPKYLWGKAILTAYLINRMHTEVLNFNSPLDSLKMIFPASHLSTPFH